VAPSCPRPGAGRALRVRSLDEGERQLVRDLGVSVYTMTDLDRRGVQPVLREALELVAARASSTSRWTWTSSIRTSPPAWAPRSGGGLSYREAHLAMELVAESGLMDRWTWSR
jgi:arginase